MLASADAPVLMQPRLLSVYLGLGRADNLSENTGKRNGTEGDETSARISRLTEKEKVVLDFHYYNYAFCKERRFDARATSTFLSIMKDILDEVRRILTQLPSTEHVSQSHGLSV